MIMKIILPEGFKNPATRNMVYFLIISFPSFWIISWCRLVGFIRRIAFFVGWSSSPLLERIVSEPLRKSKLFPTRATIVSLYKLLTSVAVRSEERRVGKE